MQPIYPRKIQLNQSHILLKGPPLCGKSTIAKEHLKDALYVDELDLRFSPEIYANLDPAKGLIIANAKSIDSNLLKKLKSLKGCVVISNYISDLDGFKTVNLNYLDYEEFCCFYSGHNAMGDYLLKGRSAVAANSALNARQMQINLAASIGAKNLSVLSTIALNVGKKASLAALFRQHLTKAKMGKNEFYAAVYSLMQEGLVFSIQNFQAAGHRWYLSDFAHRNILCAQKNFSATFNNLIACELSMVYDELNFAKDFDFIAPQSALGVISDAFLDESFALLNMRKLSKSAANLGLKTVLFLSLNVSFSRRLGGLKFIAMPLENWLLSKDELLD